jgi:hypothetical protein
MPDQVRHDELRLPCLYRKYFIANNFYSPQAIGVSRLSSGKPGKNPKNPVNPV